MSPEIHTPAPGETFLRENLVQRSLPNSLEEVAGQERIPLHDLPSHFSNVVQTMIDYASAHSFVLEDELREKIDFVYRTWYSSRNLPDNDPLYSFAKTLNSFDTFVTNYLSNASYDAQVNIMKRIDRYIHSTLQQSRILDVVSPAIWRYNTFGRYNTQGEWIRIPKILKSNNREVYATREVLEEVVALRGEEADEDLLFHSTGSAALPGIGRQLALLNSRDAHSMHELPKTGEYITDSTGDYYEKVGRRRVLSSIYTSSAMHRGYSQARWFDEFHITFGISLPAQQEYLQKNYPECILDEIDLQDIAGEGIEVGPKVPLQNIHTVYVEFVHKKDVEQWVQKHCPHVKVISYEAYEILKKEKMNFEYADPIQTAEELFMQQSIQVT